MLSSVGQDNPERYKYACVVLHKLIKFKSLSSAQNYLLLSMPLDRSFLFSFPQNVFSFCVSFHRSGLVLHSHRTHSRYSVPALQHPSRTHSRYSGPAMENSPHTSSLFWSRSDACCSRSDAIMFSQSPSDSNRNTCKMEARLNQEPCHTIRSDGNSRSFNRPNKRPLTCRNDSAGRWSNK